jgi:peptidyl-prolyl cis-trans isomerase C
MTRIRWSTIAAALLAAGCATTAPPSPEPTSAPPAPAARPATPAPTPTPSAELLATVGEERITVDDFQREMRHRGGGREPGRFGTVEQREALLDEMIRDRAVVAAARGAGLADDPEFRATVDRMLAARYLRANLDPAIEGLDATPEEIAAYYESHRAEFMTPERVRAAWAFFVVSPKADDAAVAKVRRRAEEARAAAEKLPAETANLGSVAQQFSEDTATRYTGGELGWLYLDQAESYRLGPELIRAAFALEAPGALSPILRNEKGFYFLKLVQREASTPTPIEKLRAGIRARILTEKREAARQAFFAELLQGTRVTVDSAKLAAVPAPGPDAETKTAPPPLPAN